MQKFHLSIEANLCVVLLHKCILLEKMWTMKPTHNINNWTSGKWAPTINNTRCQMTVWTLSRHSVWASCADCGELYFPPSLEKSPPHCGEVFTHSPLPCNYMPRLSTFKSTRSAACARPSGALTQKHRLLSRIRHMPSALKSETDLPPQVRKWLGAFCQRHSFAEETENVCGAPLCGFNKLVWDILRSEVHTRGRDAGLSTWNVSMWEKKTMFINRSRTYRATQEVVNVLTKSIWIHA